MPIRPPATQFTPKTVSIKTVGTQTFLCSSSNKLAINLANVVKVFSTDYNYHLYPGAEDGDAYQEPILGQCLGIQLTDESVTYIASTPEGTVRKDRRHYHVYQDEVLVTTLLETFF